MQASSRADGGARRASLQCRLGPVQRPYILAAAEAAAQCPLGPVQRPHVNPSRAPAGGAGPRTDWGTEVTRVSGETARDWHVSRRRPLHVGLALALARCSRGARRHA